MFALLMLAMLITSCGNPNVGLSESNLNSDPSSESFSDSFQESESDSHSEQKEYLRVYDAESPEEVVKYLYDNNIIINELKTDKIGLEEYYINLMKTKEVK